MTNWVLLLLCSITLGLGKGIHATTSFSISCSGPIKQFQDLSDYQTNQVPVVGTLKPVPYWVIQYRGGQRWNDNDDDDDEDANDDSIDDDYDDYEGEEDDEEGTLDKDRDGPATDRHDHSMIDPPSTRSRPSKPTALPRQGQVLNQDNPNATSSPNPLNRQPPPSRRRRRRSSSKHWTRRIASQGFKVGSQLAWGAVQQTGNVAYQLIKPRHVDPVELMGLWRLDQQIVVSNGVDLASVATVEMDTRQQLLTLKLPNGKTIVEPYTFQKTRLGSYQTEFVIPAFLVGDTPRLYGYRGTWQRKLADQRVIKLVGKIYKVKQQRFGKSKGKYTFSQPIGTFVARRRMKLLQDDEEEEFSDNDSAENDDRQDDDDGQHMEYDDQEDDSE